MKILLRLAVILCLVGIKSYAQEAPIYGTWDVDDYRLSIEVNCDCTPEENSAITKDLKNIFKEQFDNLFLLSYLEFFEDNTVVGEMGKDEVKGTYQQVEDTIFLKLTDIEHELNIIHKDEERFLQFSIASSLLGSVKSYEMDKVGKVEFRCTELTLFLSNIFDEPYEDHVDGEWE